jgi:hypothetical protein
MQIDAAPVRACNHDTYISHNPLTTSAHTIGLRLLKSTPHHRESTKIELEISFFTELRE